MKELDVIERTLREAPPRYQVADALSALATVRQRMEEMEAVCDEIRRIMETYREQEATPYGVDTPGGLGNMGDVWSKFHKWDARLAAVGNAQEITELRPLGGYPLSKPLPQACDNTILDGVFNHEDGCRAPDYGECTCKVQACDNSSGGQGCRNCGSIAWMSDGCCGHCGIFESSKSTPQPDPRTEALGWAYQAIGARWPNGQALDNLSAVSRGLPVPHEWPVIPPDPRDARIARLEEALRGLREEVRANDSLEDLGMACDRADAALTPATEGGEAE